MSMMSNSAAAKKMARIPGKGVKKHLVEVNEVEDRWQAKAKGECRRQFH